MTEHTVGTRAEWLAAREALLREEKELTRLNDVLSRRRRALPWVTVDVQYRFDTVDGSRTLAELFDGRDQLIVYHLMLGPDQTAACPGCSYTADSLDGAHLHLEQHGVAFVAVSRAPIEAIEAYKARMGWRFTWVSAHGSDFNLDIPGAAGLDVGEHEVHGMSAFALAGGVVHHTYSAFDRGTEVLNATWQLLDRAPGGREGAPARWPRRHDEYAAA